MKSGGVEKNPLPFSYLTGKGNCVVMRRVRQAAAMERMKQYE